MGWCHTHWTERSRRCSKWTGCAALTALALSAASCSFFRPTDAPLERWEYFARSRPSETLVVFLPGVFDSGKDFETHGFVQAVRNAGLPVDMVAVQAHVRHYAEGAVVERLRTDIIEPARVRGYRSIKLVGISLGGYGALLYARAHPAHLDSIVLLAPFLGDGTGGAFDAAERMDRLNREDDPLWAWLARHSAQSSANPTVFLAFGEEDKYAPVNARLAGLLPADRVLRTSGQHDWPTWRRLWTLVLERGWLSKP